MSLLGLAVAASWLGCRARPEEPGSSGASSSRKDPNALHLLFTYGSEKEEWIKDMTARFNDGGHRTASGKVIQIEAVPQGSGELIDDLLAGARQAHLTSPASAAFIKLGNAQSRARTGKDLIGETRNLVLSPVVIAMWRPMAEAIGWGRRPVGWSEVLALARDPAGWASHGHPEWGAFKLGHTHPEYSNRGLISLLAEAYAGAGKVAGLSLVDLQRPETASYVAGIESAVVHYGSSTGFFGRRMFEGGPKYLSAAVLYENMVIESYGPEYQKPFPVVAIYPKEGTFWSDHPVGIVERPTGSIPGSPRQLTREAGVGAFERESLREALDRIVWTYLKLLTGRQHLEASRGQANEADLQRKTAELEENLAAAGESSTLRESQAATLKILRQRLDNLRRFEQTLKQVDSDLARIEAQVDLVLENAGLRGSGAAVTANLELAGQILDDGLYFGDADTAALAFGVEHGDAPPPKSRERALSR